MFKFMKILPLCIVLLLVSSCGNSASGSAIDFSNEKKAYSQKDLTELLNYGPVDIVFKSGLTGSHYRKAKDSEFSFETYWGEMKNGKPHGKGILGDMDSNGLLTPYYIGEFKSGKKDGFGMEFDLSNNLKYSAVFIIYEGYFKNGLYHGKGNSYQYQSQQYLMEDFAEADIYEFELDNSLVATYKDTTAVEAYLGLFWEME